MTRIFQFSISTLLALIAAASVVLAGVAICGLFGAVCSSVIASVGAFFAYSLLRYKVLFTLPPSAFNRLSVWEIVVLLISFVTTFFVVATLIAPLRTIEQSY